MPRHVLTDQAWSRIHGFFPTRADPGSSHESSNDPGGWSLDLANGSAVARPAEALRALSDDPWTLPVGERGHPLADWLPEDGGEGLSARFIRSSILPPRGTGLGDARGYQVLPGGGFP